MTTPFSQVEDMFYPKHDWGEVAKLLDACGADGKIESILENLVRVHPIEEWQAQQIGENSKAEYEAALEQRSEERMGLIKLAIALRKAIRNHTATSEASALIGYEIGYAHARAHMRAAHQAIWVGGRILQSQTTKKKRDSEEAKFEREQASQECKKLFEQYFKPGLKKAPVIKRVCKELGLTRTKFYELMKT